MILRSDSEILKASLVAGYVGGGYYNPIDEFMDRARLLNSQRLTELSKLSLTMKTEKSIESTFYVSRLYQEINSLVSPGEVIFGVYEKNGQYRFAVQITIEERLMDFENQVGFGNLKGYGFFVLDGKQADEWLMRDFILPNFIKKDS